MNNFQPLYICLRRGKYSSFIKRQKCPSYSPTSVSALLNTSHPPAFSPICFHCLLWVQLKPLSHSHRTNRTAFFIHCNLRHLLSQTNHFEDSHRHKPDARSLIYSAMPFKMQHVSVKREWTSECTLQLKCDGTRWRMGGGIKGETGEWNG